jgi:hypothetical protein
LEGAILIDPSSNYLEKTLGTRSPKIKSNVPPSFHKSEVVLGISWELGEHNKNKMRTKKKNQKIKNQPFSLVA